RASLGILPCRRPLGNRGYCRSRSKLTYFDESVAHVLVRLNRVAPEDVCCAMPCNLHGGMLVNTGSQKIPGRAPPKTMRDEPVILSGLPVVCAKPEAGTSLVPHITKVPEIENVVRRFGKFLAHSFSVWAIFDSGPTSRTACGGDSW